MPVEIPPHGLIYALVPLTRRVACVLHVLPNSSPQNGYLTVSTITLFFIELLEALDSENMERLL